MPDALPPVRPVEDPPPISILGGILSYLIPGLGQIAQGRIGKGLLFMVTLLGMFHLGQAMGHWQNVYMPPVEPREGNPIRKPLISVYNRWHFAGQFWIGIAAWPAIYQFYSPPTEADLIDLPVDEGGNVIPEAHVSVMGGMPVAVDDQNQPIKGARVIKGLSFWREFQLAPVGEAENRLNRLLTNDDKTPDLGWVYTVVAGMLNILVIYDAVMGPVFIAAARRPDEASGGQPAASGAQGAAS